MNSSNVNDNLKRQSGSPYHWSWTGFACGFVLVGILMFFDMTMPFSERFWPHVTETLIVAAIGGVLVGLFGDVVFAKILSVLRWL